MFTTQDIEAIHKVIASFPKATQFAIAKVKGNEAAHYGVLKTDTGIETITNENAIFEIGSITKVFTSNILAQMVVEQQLDLDEPIHQKLSILLRNNSVITYKELATHSSGLPSIPFALLLRTLFGDKSNPYRDFSERKLLDYLKNHMRLKKKGVLRYSNIGVGLLGYVLSKHTNQTYEKLLQQRLFSPLNMSNSTTNREHIMDKLVTGLDKKGKSATNWDLNILAGAGAALSSTSDLAKFMLANINHSDNAMRLQRQCMYQKGKNSMGLGWFILDNQIPNANQVYFHNGGTGGYRSSMVMDIEKGNGIVILSNVSGLYLFKGSRVDKLAFKLLENCSS